MKRQEKSGFREWFAWAWIAFILFIAMFKNGIFLGFGLHSPNQYQFESPAMLTLIVSAFVTLWLIVQMSASTFEWTRANLIMSALALLLPLVYLVSSFQAFSPYMAKIGILIHLALFLFYAAGTFWSRSNQLTERFPLVFLIFGYLLVAYGFLTMFGNAYMLDSLTPQDGIRITSVFQYANAYAVLLLIMWIIMLIEISRTTRRGLQIFHGIMLVPVLVSFFLTLSRGALVVLPIIAIVTLAMLRLKLQIKMILYSVIGMGIALLIYSKLADRGIEVVTGIQAAIAAEQPYDTVSIFSGDAIGYWAILIVASLAMGAITYAIERYIEPRLQEKVGNRASNRSGIWLPIGLLVLFILGAAAVLSDTMVKLLPPVLRNRIEGVNLETHSVYERLRMYKNAIQLWKDYPVFGGGSGAWEASYEKYQSYPYLSAQTHSFITQLLVEVGIVGAVAILGLILYSLISFAIKYRRMSEELRNKYIFYFIVPITILLHASIDFEMSYLLYDILVFLCLGVLGGALSPVKQWGEKQARQLKIAGSSILAALGVGLIVIASLRLYSSNQIENANDAYAQQRPFNEIVDLLEQGLKVTAGHPVLLQQLTSWNYQAYDQSEDESYLVEAEKYLQKLVKTEPYYRPGIDLDYTIQLVRGNQDGAIQIMQKAVAQYPFEQTFYDRLETTLLAKWEQQTQANDVEGAKTTAASIMEYYSKVLEQERIVQELPKTVEVNRVFAISSATRLAAGEVTFSAGDYAQATEILKPTVQEDLSAETNRKVARYYLASLRKQGQDDQALYEKLVAVDANEAGQLDQLN
ncbi:O-antigen ligase family protein [Cohnella sp. JJ-181]|uniref:O-antigen ligase family protein n=1 Tax=Cohnella rhizoplanae TaxID=2974897 RepID=UPI0022FF9282|nr:O-antigen ligase family protein [Cohnella sp. JJ-181]CAI6082015.1 hypothetical protein COHCIP112018_03505 [Cohnella sp. JJ-181]